MPQWIEAFSWYVDDKGLKELFVIRTWHEKEVKCKIIKDMADTDSDDRLWDWETRRHHQIVY